MLDLIDVDDLSNQQSLQTLGSLRRLIITAINSISRPKTRQSKMQNSIHHLCRGILFSHIFPLPEAVHLSCILIYSNTDLQLRDSDREFKLTEKVTEGDSAVWVHIFLFHIVYYCYKKSSAFQC